MKRKLFIFIGGSDEQNGDYSAVHDLARRGGASNWSSLKDAKPGDAVLIYIRRPHSALVTKAEVLAKPVRGTKGDYAYRAKIGHFELLPNRVSIRDLKHAFPRWAWLRMPRKNCAVPTQYADQLWKLVHEKSSDVQILMTGGQGKKLLEGLATTGRGTIWFVPKLTTIGDVVLFYAEAPLSAIVAVGKALSRPRATNLKWYEAKVGSVRMLDAPITLAELRIMFPDWLWLRSVNMFAYVTPERSKALLERCNLESSMFTKELARSAGGGFGDPETNSLVEQAAVRKVTQILKRRGFKVSSRERERIGYDLEAKKGKTELHVEVKGVSGDGLQFLITQAEVAKAKSDLLFRLMVVTEARTSSARVQEFSGQDFKRVFALTPVSYFAERKR
jgi:hypothetical protein